MMYAYQKTLLISSLFLGLSSPLTAQEHAASKMMAVPPKNADQTKNLADVRAATISVFRNKYRAVGEPKLAIFWNREFDDQLSQWVQVFRKSQTGESAVQGEDKFEPSDESSGYKRSVSGGSNIIKSEYIETLAEKKQRTGFSEADGFEFSSGVTATFLSASTKIVDRQTILRLVQRDNALEAGTEIISDYQKIETDALVGYADYFAEILLTPESKAGAGFSFMVKVTNISNGQVIAMFKSNADKPLTSPAKPKWVATDKGFEKVSDQRKIGTPNEVGQQLAYEIMEKLNQVW